MKAAVFLITGFEEIEAITTVDILRRGEVDTKMISLVDQICVTGAHNIIVQAELAFSDALNEDFDMLILPGGSGTANYQMHEAFLDYLCKQEKAGKIIAAICAAPTILGKLGLLRGRRAVCYAGMEGDLTDAFIGEDIVEVDGSVVTSKGPGTAPYFALELLRIAAGSEIAETVRKGLLLDLISYESATLSL
jgi:4-methyl-5(b-hydroxyethyl)-thiazole monophosphate biosynthesis